MGPAGGWGRAGVQEALTWARESAWRYAFGAIAPAIGYALTVMLATLVAPMRLFFLWTAVLLTAVVAGTGPALLATAISVCIAGLLMVAPLGSLSAVPSIDVIRLALFGVFAGGISVAVGLRRRAEERAARLAARLRGNELRYRTLVEATPSPQALWTATPGGTIEWSDEWLAITGLTRDAVARNGTLGVVHADDAERTWRRWKAALASESQYSDEIRVRSSAGHYRWFAIRAVPVRGDDGVLIEWAGVVTDVHDRRRHEENAAFINRATEVLNASLQREPTLRHLARVCVPALGDWCAIHLAREGRTYERVAVEHVDPARTQLALSLDNFARPPADRDPIVNVIESGRPQLVEELTDEMRASMDLMPEQERIIRELGLRSWIIAPMTTRGRTLGTLTVVHGDSGRRYTEEDIPLIVDLASRAATAVENALLYEQAQAANRAKDEFLATLSHELRTPLTAISGWAHMLQAGIADTDTQRLAIDTIARSAKAQGELIDDLLDLSRVVAGTLHLNVATNDLGHIVEDVTVAARPAADAKGLTLTMQCDPPVVLVRGDERRLRQIVWNLVSNSVKFTDRGGSIEVRLTARGEHARVEVIDTGCGVEESFLPYVWDRFRQADSSTSRVHGGLGLGLSVVRHLVELHGGTVEAKSEGTGRGSTFAFEIPLARPVEVRRSSASLAVRSDAPLRGRRILVVDDDADARIVIGAMLRQAGGEITAADSVEGAVRELSSHAFDLVVTDIAMPGEDGYSLLRRVQRRWRTPVVAVSAIGTGADDRNRALAAGFADFVRKPVDPEQIATVAARVSSSGSSGSSGSSEFLG